MFNTYGGESPAKTLARREYWLSIQRLFPANFRRGHHLVLCGTDAGDVRQCSALRSGPVTAVDRCAKTAQDAAWSYFKDHDDASTFMVGDITKLSFPHKFRSIFLDWCGIISPKLLDASLEVAANNLKSHDKFGKPGALGLGFMRARDGLAGGADASERIAVILDHFKKRKAPYKLHKSWVYQSAKKDSVGSPMLYLLFTHRIFRDHDIVALLMSKRVEASYEDVEQQAKALLGTMTTQQVADSFMLRPKTVSAWRANKTRKR